MQKVWSRLGKITEAASETLINALLPHAAPLPLAAFTTKAISRSKVGRSRLQAALVVCTDADDAGLTVSRGLEELRWLLWAQIPVTRGNRAPAGQEVAQAPQQMGQSSL